MTSRRKEIFFVALCVVFSALFTIGCSDSLLHPAQDGARILVQLENSSLRSGDTPSPTEKWQGSAWIENQNGSESHHQDISSAADEFSITFENVVVGSEIKICLDMTSTGDTPKRYTGSSNWREITSGINVFVIVLKEVVEQGGDEPGQENPPSQEPGTTTPEGELGSQTNPVTTWTDLQNLIENGTNPIYISGTMDASETIMVTDAAVELISVGNTTIIRNSLLSDELFLSEQSLTFTGSQNASIIFAGNDVQATSPMISAAANLTMTYCTLQNNVNTSTSGGAIHITEGVLKLNHCFFESNKTMSSTGQGGALCVEGKTTTSHITSCTFRNNTSSYGGGAIVIDGDVSSGTDYTHTLDDCSFTGNSIKEGNGGGIYIASGFVTLNEISMSANTIANNKNQDIFLYYQSSLTFDGTVDISNVYYNFATTTYPKLMVLSNFNQTSSVGITLFPSLGVTYPDSLQLFTLEDGVDKFDWVNNFSIQTEDGTTTYVLSDYGSITKQ